MVSKYDLWVRTGFCLFLSCLLCQTCWGYHWAHDLPFIYLHVGPFKGTCKNLALFDDVGITCIIYILTLNQYVSWHAIPTCVFSTLDRWVHVRQERSKPPIFQVVHLYFLGPAQLVRRWQLGLHFQVFFDPLATAWKKYPGLRDRKRSLRMGIKCCKDCHCGKQIHVKIR